MLEDSAKLLSEFGLTYYEAKVYITALQIGVTTASKIAKQADIRREEVYRTIPKLERVGLIERILGRPVKVKALPLQEGLNTLFKMKEEEASHELKELISKKEEVLKKFDYVVRGQKPEEEQSHFVLISEKDVLSRKINSAIVDAKKSVDFVDSFENAFRFILSYGDVLKIAKKKNVDVRILTECPEEIGLIPEYLKKQIPHNSFTVRYSENIPSRYILIDKKQAMITTSAGGSFSDGACLWTNDHSLIGIVNRDFEEQFRDALDWRDLSVAPTQKLTRILNRLRPRDHVVLFYDSLKTKHETLFAYIADGLDRDEAAAYVCSEESVAEIRDAMSNYGLDVKIHEDSGALQIFNYTDVYIVDGEFNLDHTLDFWNRTYTKALSKGFKGMRVTGEMSCFIEYNLIQELINYERALHTVLDIPMTAICAYNANILASIENPIDIYSELVKAHGKVLFAGEESIGKIEVRAG
ncbi:MAG: MEDS domain-containing protein [Candidatus Thorarchaeota archaeon]|nr:MEDS domain-containing protein [Candidatus Thorarchaeota archaeon]